MEGERIPRKVLDGHFGGRRMVGRPRIQWEEMVRKDAKDLLGIRNWRTMARNREEWKVLIGEAVVRRRTGAPQHHHHHCPDLTPSDLHLTYTSINFCLVRVSIFRMTKRWRWVSQWFQSQAANLYDSWYKSWSHSMTNDSIPEVNMLKNNSTLAVSVPINPFIKLVLFL